MIVEPRGRSGLRVWLPRLGLMGALALGASLLLGNVESAESIPTDAAAQSVDLPALDFAFYRDNVEPIFMRPRGGFRAGTAPCASCHTFQATTPLKLERLQEEGARVFWTEEQSRRNFAVVARLVTPGDPDNSRLLRKPLAVSAGGAPQHTGGKYWDSKDDPEWRVIAEWVRNAGPATAPPPAPPEVDFQFFRSCVQPIVINPIPNAVACAECHAGGSRGFGRPIPAGQATWTEEESRAAYDALMQLIEPGHPEYSRFLHHPLAIAAGGDFMHNGGRRWLSKEEPEWQALAAWIRGESRGTNCPAALRFPRP